MPKEVLVGITAVRDSGLTNMLAVPVVVRLAKEMGYSEVARWIEAHRADYAEVVLFGPAGE